MFYNDNFRQDGNFGYGDGIDININNTNSIYFNTFFICPPFLLTLYSFKLKFQ